MSVETNPEFNEYDEHAEGDFILGYDMSPDLGLFGYIDEGEAVLFWSHDTNMIYELSEDVIYNPSSSSDYLKEIVSLPPSHYPVIGIYAQNAGYALVGCYYIRSGLEYIPYPVFMTLDGNSLNSDSFFSRSISRDYYYMFTFGGASVAVNNRYRFLSWTFIMSSVYIDVEFMGTVFDMFHIDTFGYAFFYGGTLSSYLYGCTTVNGYFTIASTYWHSLFFQIVPIPMAEFAFGIIPLGGGVWMPAVEVNLVFVHAFTYDLPRLGFCNVPAIGTKLLFPVMTLYRYSIDYVKAIVMPSYFYSSYVFKDDIAVVNVFSKRGFPIYLFDYMNDNLFTLNQPNETDVSKISFAGDGVNYMYASSYTDGLFPKYFMFDDFYDVDFPFFMMSEVSGISPLKTSPDSDDFQYKPIDSSTSKYFNYIYSYSGSVSFKVYPFSVSTSVSSDSITGVEDSVNRGLQSLAPSLPDAPTISPPIHTWNTIDGYKKAVSYINTHGEGIHISISGDGIDVSENGMIPLGVFSCATNIGDLFFNIAVESGVFKIDKNRNAVLSDSAREELSNFGSVYGSSNIIIPFIVSYISHPNGKPILGAGTLIPSILSFFHRINVVAYHHYAQNSVYDRLKAIIESYVHGNTFTHAIRIFSVAFSASVSISQTGDENNPKFSISVSLEPNGLVAKSDLIHLSSSKLFIPTPIFVHYNQFNLFNQSATIDIYINDDSKIRNIVYEPTTGRVVDDRIITDVGISISVPSRYVPVVLD